ncbi:hypothetical protein EFK50_13160 [Nocardioides marmoriginsengisoli]|uniref:Uncharacterized protein n=1 Tax=Nocardioides marmoriginsengisoli TaxID=661483 RepID=A0A3N0CGY8_9ACTN|nr:hypothetical protein [Nocardioides marmoriginsengisoli]RNL62695.1 hypothetical protein EFK50_13160 [Nocardioides marmoriginsengisoli]
MDFDALEPSAETAALLSRIMADFAPDDPEQPWTDGEMRIAVPVDYFPLPELARAALRWAGYVPQRWDDKTSWRLGGRFRDRNVSLSSTKFGLRFMVEADVTGFTHNLLDISNDDSEDDLDPEANLIAAAENVESGLVEGDIASSGLTGSGPTRPTATTKQSENWLDEIDDLLKMASRTRVPKAMSSTRHDLSEDPDLDTFFHDFLTRLGRAVQVFDQHVFAKVVKEQVSAGNITLLNQHARLRGAYDYFRWQAQAFIDGHGDDELRQEMAGMGFLAAGGKPGEHFLMPLVVRNQLGYCLTAMASAYFSWLEHVLVLALPFTGWEPQERSVTEVIGDTWSLKWKRVIPACPEADEVFIRLKVAVEEFRNLDAHGGFGKKERALLIHTPVGAIPARLTEGAGAVKATVIPDTPTGFPQACDVFDATDAFLQTGPMASAMQWIEAGIQVPFNADHRQMLKKAMSEVHEPFEATVNRYSELEDRVNNFEM